MKGLITPESRTHPNRCRLVITVSGNTFWSASEASSCVGVKLFSAPVYVIPSKALIPWYIPSHFNLDTPLVPSSFSQSNSVYRGVAASDWPSTLSKKTPATESMESICLTWNDVRALVATR